MILTTDINAPKHIVSGNYNIKSYDDQLLAGGTLAYTFDAPNVTSLFNTPEKIPAAVIDKMKFCYWKEKLFLMMDLPIR